MCVVYDQNSNNEIYIHTYLLNSSNIMSAILLRSASPCSFKTSQNLESVSGSLNTFRDFNTSFTNKLALS